MMRFMPYNSFNLKMHYQSGNMRQINHEFTPVKNSWERQNEFHFAQRSKYEKSEVSYVQPQKSKVYYDEQRTDRYKGTQSKELVDRQIPMKIKCSDREDILTFLRVQLINSNEKGANCIIMHITDVKNSLFLWSFYIRQSDFLTLKTQQSLRVDFHGFPEVINEHLCLCGDAEANIQENKPAFLAAFEIKKGNDQAELKILQVNKFKQSLHLSLKFKKANDEQLKIYLGEKYDEKCEQNQKLKKQISKLESSLGQRKHEIEKLHYEYENYRKVAEVQKQSFEKVEKEKILNLKEQTRDKYQKKEKEREERVKEQIETLNKDIEKLKVKNEELERKYEITRSERDDLECKQRQLTLRISALEQQTKHYSSQYDKLRKMQESIRDKLIKAQTQNASMKAKIEGLVKEIQNKEVIIQQNNDAKAANGDQIQQMQVTVRQEKKKLQKIEEKYENLQNQLAKTNAKYNELNHKYLKKKDKIAEYKNMMNIQEEEIEEREKKIKRINDEFYAQKRSTEKLQSELSDRQIKIKDFKAKLDESQRMIQDHKKMIEHLNKQINERVVGVRSFANTSSFQPTFSTAVNRNQYTASFNSTSESRLKYSNPMQKTDKTERITPPPIKRYGGVENNDMNKEKERERSKSPMVGRLNQQTDPEQCQADKTKERIQPIKFKK